VADARPNAGRDIIDALSGEDVKAGVAGVVRPMAGWEKISKDSSKMTKVLDDDGGAAFDDDDIGERLHGAAADGWDIDPRLLGADVGPSGFHSKIQAIFLLDTIASTICRSIKLEMFKSVTTH
jgi:hypothetical protein